MEDVDVKQASFEGWALLAFRELANLHAVCVACASKQRCSTALLLGQWTAIRNQSEWYPLRGFEGRYEITQEGLIRSVLTGAIRKWAFPSGKIQYPSVQIWKNNKPLNLLVHVMVAENFLPPRPTPLHEVNHADGNKLNPHIDNLEWMTRSENMAHAWRTGLRTTTVNCAQGESHPQSKLTTVAVEQLRRRREDDGISYVLLGKEFGVAHSTARRVCEKARS